MTDFNGYAVFFFPNAIEALGDAIKPYLQDSPGGPHILCRDIDVGGALAELTVEGRTTDGRQLDLELMFPTNMVRMIVSARSDASFGFGPRTAVQPAPSEAPLIDDREPGPAHPPGEAAPPRTVPGRAARAAKAARADKSPASSTKAGKAKPAKKTKKTKKTKKAAKAAKAAKAPAKPAARRKDAKKAR